MNSKCLLQKIGTPFFLRKSETTETPITSALVALATTNDTSGSAKLENFVTRHCCKNKKSVTVCFCDTKCGWPSLCNKVRQHFVVAAADYWCEKAIL